MLVVVFRARLRPLPGDLPDDEYLRTAQRLRELAFAEFGCLGFHACTEGLDEVALSYWPDRTSIRAWREHPEHVRAQELGRERWYESYSVEVCEVLQKYEFPRAGG